MLSDKPCHIQRTVGLPVEEPFGSYNTRRARNILVSAIIPCYNEASGIAPTIAALQQELPDGGQRCYEFIFVDDHSLDDTPNILLTTAQSDERIKVVRLGCNRGSHVACRAGLEVCSGDVALFLTADLQEGPILVPQLIDAWAQGADVVCTIAEDRERDSLPSEAFARLYYLLVGHSGRFKDLEDPRANPRLLDRKAIDHYCQYAPRGHNLGAWLLQQGFQLAYVRYTPAKRRFGHSKWTLRKRLVLAMNTLVDITPVFLTGWSILGALLVVLGLSADIWGALRALLAGGDFTPSEGLVTAALLLGGCTLLIGGLILAAIGTVGVYLWRIYDGLRNGPEFTVQWTANLTATPNDSPVAGESRSPESFVANSSGL